MYRKDKPPCGPPPLPPFGPPLPYGYPFRYRGPSSVPPGHLPPRPCGSFSASAPDSHYANNGTPRGRFIRPPCSSFSIDHSTMNALGSNQQIVPPADTPGLQVPQWNAIPVEHRPSDNSDRAGEEFLRCIAANKPLPDYLKGNMAYNLADAFKSANVLKEAVKSDPEAQKHLDKSRSRSQSKDRSRGRSRAKSRARSKSRVRSRSRGRSKSRARSRAKSRARSKSRERSRSRTRARSRAKSRARNKSRERSRSRSCSRSKKGYVRSKSRARRSRSRSSEEGRDKKRRRSPDHNSSNRLLEGLKLVKKSKELEEWLPTHKDSIETIKASDECKTGDRERSSQSPENDSMLLPHERVGSDFFWLQGNRQHDSPVRKAEELEDEESFLYGNESAQIGRQIKLPEMDCSTSGTQQYQQNKPMFSSLEDLLDPIQKNLSNPILDKIDFEKIKCLSQNLGTFTDISDIMAKVKEQPCAPITAETAAVNQALPDLSNPDIRQALESLQSLIRATKEKRIKSDDTPQTSCDKQKAGGSVDRRKERLNKVSQMESTGKELAELLNQDGLNFLIPVIGFYCQKCEEFIGDICSAEKHGASHQQSNSRMHEDNKGQCYSSSCQQQPSDRRDRGDYGYHRDSGEHRKNRDYQRRPECQDDVSLKDKMRGETMLITVSHGLTPPNFKVKEEVKEQTDSKDSRESRERTESSDVSSDDDRERSPRSKHAKKKKKKKERKKKKRKRERS